MIILKPAIFILEVLILVRDSLIDFLIGVNIISVGHYKKADTSAPSILLSQVHVPSTPSMLLSIYICIASCRKDESKQKEAGIGPFFRKTVSLKATTK